ncbi:hypothetical protein vseg_018140 [Gypsophila vaccaria]
MGNANGREGGNGVGPDYSTMFPNPSSDSMGHSPPESPSRSRSPLMFNPQLPLAPLPRGDGALFRNEMWQTELHGTLDQVPEKGIPTLITWSLGGNNVAVEGSWDNWTSRKILQRSGKDHSVLLVLPSGIYHYRFVVDGETQYMPDLPYVSSEMGLVCNVLDVNDYVPESLDSIAEFEPPPSPDESYGHTYPEEEEFAKDPIMVPSQVHLTVLGTQKSSEASSSRPQHVVLEHLFIEKGWAASQSVVALGLSHRFQSKYVTVVLYKPLRR